MMLMMDRRPCRPVQAYLKYGVPQNQLKKTSLLVKVKPNLTYTHTLEQDKTIP